MSRPTARTVFHATTLLAGLALAGAAGLAQADQSVQSSDGQWKLSAKISDPVPVGKSSEALISVSPAGGAKGCPTVASTVFEMPAHGHGGDKTPSAMAMDGCTIHVSDLSPTMGGAWRLRLVLKSGDKSSNADFAVTAK